MIVKRIEGVVQYGFLANRLIEQGFELTLFKEDEGAPTDSGTLEYGQIEPTEILRGCANGFWGQLGDAQ